MRFWDDMQNKFGFADGEAMPDGVELYRRLYIRTVNRLAEALGSQVRAVAYNRFGFHNFCLILFYPLQALEQREIQDLSSPLDWAYDELTVPGAPMQVAIQEAYALELDSFASVSVEIADGFEEFLSNLPNSLPPNEA